MLQIVSGNKEGGSIISSLHKFIISKKNMYMYNYTMQQDLIGCMGNKS